MRLFHKKFWNKIFILPAIFGMVVAFSLGIYLSKFIDQELNRVCNEQLIALREKAGIAIAIGRMESRFGSVLFSEVSIGSPAWMVIDKIQVSVSFNPFRNFLKPGDVKIGQLVSKIPWNRKDWPEELDMIAKRVTRTEEGETGEGPQPNNLESSRMSKIAAYIPRKLYIMASKIELADQDVSKFFADQARLEIDLTRESVGFSAGQVKFLDLIDESDVEGVIERGAEKVVALKLSRRRDFSGDPLWSYDCDLRYQRWEMVCESQSREAPNSLVKLVNNRLGKGFSPGFTGQFKLSSVEHMVQDGSRLTRSNLKHQSSIPKQWMVGVNGYVENLNVEHHSLSVSPIGPVGFHVRLAGGVDLTRNRLLINEGEIRWGGRHDATGSSQTEERSQSGNEVLTKLTADLAMNSNDAGARQLKGSLLFDVPAVNCMDAYLAIPRAFIPELDHFELTGDLELHGAVNISPESSEVKLRNSRFNCLTTSSPAQFSAAYLNEAFVIERDTNEGIVRIHVDPARPYFAKVNDIPSLVRSAFVSSEDTGFFHHHGVEIGAIIGAVEKNTQAGRAVVGGSTITMQTVKNLFLARDKTVSRKLQEMFLAWHLENTISKERILEIYLNMVELGPGLYGVGQAAQRFFGKSYRDLSLKEAIYLASLLPAPVPRYQYFCKGEITPNYLKIINQLLDRMLTLGRISYEQHAAAQNEPIRFSSLEREETCRRDAVPVSPMDAEDSSESE